MVRCNLSSRPLSNVSQILLAAISRVTRSRKWFRLTTCYGSHYRREPVVIHYNGEPMMLTGAGGDGDSLWQKNILMGGKCELPDFSGVIIYDAAGDIVSPATAKASRLMLS